MTKGCRRCIWLKFLTAWAEEAFRIHQPHLKLFICFFRIHTSETWSCNCVTQNFLSPVAVEAVLIIWECAFCPMPQSHPLPPYSYDLIETLSRAQCTTRCNAGFPAQPYAHGLRWGFSSNRKNLTCIHKIHKCIPHKLQRHSKCAAKLDSWPNLRVTQKGIQ